MKVKEDNVIVEKLEIETTLESLKEEFKVLASALTIGNKAIDSLTNKVEKQDKQIKDLLKDLEIEGLHYGRTSTRKIAREAYNQSTVEANWEGLMNHPVFDNIYLAIKDSRKDLGKSIQRNALRLDNAQLANEVFKELENTDTITTIIQRLDDFDGNLQCLDDTMSVDRKNANRQDHQLIDRVADLATAQDALEFIQSETIFKHDAAFIFLMGAWAKSGFEPVAEGLRIMLKKPKEEKKKDAPPS